MFYDGDLEVLTGLKSFFFPIQHSAICVSWLLRGYFENHVKSFLTGYFLQQKREDGAIDAADKEILAEAERLDVTAMGPLILSELLFDENIRDQIKKYKRHFLRVSLHSYCYV